MLLQDNLCVYECISIFIFVYFLQVYSQEQFRSLLDAIAIS